MDRIAIVGGARLEGEIAISGAKNSAIKLMAASLLTEEPLRLTNMPRLADTRFLGQLLRRLGVEVSEIDGEDGAETVLHAPEVTSAFAPYDLVRQMRASFNVLGPLLARTGHAKVSLPGELRHRGAARGPAPEGDGGAGRAYRPARGLCLRPGAARAEGGADRLPLRLGGGDRAFDAGGGAGAWRDRAEQRRARAGVGGPGPVPERHGRPGRGGGHIDHHHHRGRAAARGDPRGDPRPDRDRHLCGGRGHGRRRGAPDKNTRRLHSGPAGQDRGGGRRGDPQQRRGDHQAQRRAAEGGGCRDRRLSGPGHRPAGPVHGPDDPGRGRERDPRDGVREPLHARARAWPAWGRHPGSGRRGAGARGRGAGRRPGDGHRSARLGQPGDRRPGGAG